MYFEFYRYFVVRLSYYSIFLQEFPVLNCLERNMSKKYKKYVLVEIKCDIIRKMICPVSMMLRQRINCNTNL